MEKTQELPDHAIEFAKKILSTVSGRRSDRELEIQDVAKLLVKYDSERPAAAPEPVATAASAPQAVSVEQDGEVFIPPKWIVDAAEEINREIYRACEFVKVQRVHVGTHHIERAIARYAPADFDAMQQRCEAAEREVERLKRACSTQQNEIQQIIGKALGYPRYCDDTENFPDATEADGVCVGDHVAESLAAEVVRKVSTITAERDKLAGELEAVRAAITGRRHPSEHSVLSYFKAHGNNRHSSCSEFYDAKAEAIEAALAPLAK